MGGTNGIAKPTDQSVITDDYGNTIYHGDSYKDGKVNGKGVFA